MKRFIAAICCTALVGLVSSLGSPAKAEGPISISEVKRETPVDFEKELLPVLRKNCLACHSSSEAESDMILENPQTILKGGASGPAVVAGKGGESLLLKVAAHQTEPVMPPADNTVGAKPLSPEELGLLKLWIDQGAKGEVRAAAPIQWHPLPPGINPIYAVAVTPDAQFAACGRANQIFLYHLPTGREIGRLSDPVVGALLGGTRPGLAHLDHVQSLAFNPAGDLLASGSYREVKLWRRSSAVRRFDLAGIGEAVRAVAVSADSKLAITSDAAGGVKLWDLSSGKEVRSLTGHTGPVTGVRFTPDGTKVVTAGHDKTIHVWNTADGVAAGQITSPAPVHTLALSNDGAQVISGDADGVIRVWAMPTSQTDAAQPATPVKELRGHNGPVNSIDTIAGVNQVLSGGEDGTVRHWNLEDGQPIRQMAHGAAVSSVAARGDGKRFASAGANNVTKLWNGENGQQVVEIKGDFRAQRQVAALERDINMTKAKIEDAKKAATEAQTRSTQEAEAVKKAMEAKTAAEKLVADKTEALKKPQADKEVADKELQAADAALKEAQAKVAAAKQAADADAANQELKKTFDDATRLSNEADQKFKQAEKKVADLKPPFDKAQAELTAAQTTLASSMRGIQSAEEAARKAADAIPVVQAAVAQIEESLKQVEASVQTAKHAATATEKPMRAVAFSRDNLRLATGGDHHLVHTYSAETGLPLETFEGHGGPVAALAFAADGVLLAGANDKSAIVWDVEADWNLERTIGNFNDPAMLVDRVLALAFNPDGRLLATGSGEPSRSGELKLWNPADGSLVRTIPDAHSDTIYSLSFSPDGNHLASSGADRFVKVWEVATGTLARSFEGHTHHVLSVDWKTDGKILATAGADSVIKVWNFNTGDQVRTIQGMSKEVTSIHFVGDTPRTVSSVGDKTVRLHNVDNGSNERTMGGAADYLFSAAVTSDGKTVLAGGQDSVLRVWNLENGQQLHAFEPPKAEAVAAQ